MDRQSNNKEETDFETKSVKLTELKADGYKFSGYASVFNGVDAYEDTIAPGAFKTALQTGEKPKMFFNHDIWGIPIGKWTTVEEDEKGLRVEGELTEGNETAEQVKAALKHGTMDGLSIGFSLRSDGYTVDPATGIRVINKIEKLREISVVTFPADDAARITEVKMSDIEDIESERDFEKVLRDSGLSRRKALALCSKAKGVFSQDRRDFDEEEASKALAKMDSILKNLDRF